MASPTAQSPWFRVIGRLGEILAPSSCGLCAAAPAEGKQALCADCSQRLLAEAYPACDRCAAILAKPTSCCGACRSNAAFPLRGVTALFRYQSVGRDLIWRLKRDQDGVLAHSLAEHWLERVRMRSDAPRATAIDFVTCIPQRPRFPWESRNVGPRFLAESIAQRLGVRANVSVLAVRKWMRRQHELTARQRVRNVRRAFRVRHEADIKDRAILIVDDVMTSGATLCSAAQTLLDGGAREVWGAVAARGQAFGAAQAPGKLPERKPTT